MDPEVRGSNGNSAIGGPGAVNAAIRGSASTGVARGSAAGTVRARNASSSDATRRGVRIVDGRAEDRHVWAIAALVFPLVFCAIVGVGVFLMFHRNMGYFKPAPSGSAAPFQNGERLLRPEHLA